jgi:peroxiredoxin
LYEKYQNKGLVVVGVNTSDDRKIALDYLKENQVTFPMVLDSSAAADQALRQYETLGMLAVPMTYLIGRDGKVVEAWYGYSEGQAESALKKVGLEPK